MDVIFQTLFQKADASGSRSTIIKPIAWILGLLLSTLVTSAFLNPTHWVTYLIGISFSLVLLAFLIVYLFCVVKNPDALRSEKYSIQKMAIEKGLVGDSTKSLLSDMESNQTLIEEGGK